MIVDLHPREAATTEPRTGALRPGPDAGRGCARRDSREPAGLLPARSRNA